MIRPTMMEKLIEAITKAEMTRDGLTEEDKIAFAKWTLEQSIQSRIAGQLEGNDELFIASEALTYAGFAALTVEPGLIAEVLSQKANK